MNGDDRHEIYRAEQPNAEGRGRRRQPGTLEKFLARRATCWSPFRPQGAARRLRSSPGSRQLQAERTATKGSRWSGCRATSSTGRSPGSAEEIAEFCSATYGVTFPMTEKIDVNGDDRHEIYRSLVEQPNEKGESGDVTWNFEKFLVDAQRRGGRQVPPQGPARRPTPRRRDQGDLPALTIRVRTREPRERASSGPRAELTRVRRSRPVTGGRSASVTMPGRAATTYGTALVTGIAV